MPPAGVRQRPRDGRQSQSRNTTPGSVSVKIVNNSGTNPTVPSEVPPDAQVTELSYEESLWRHSGPGVPDLRVLEMIGKDLTSLELQAGTKGEALDILMRECSEVQRARLDEKERVKRVAEEKVPFKRFTDDDSDAKASRTPKPKKQKKGSDSKEERPLTHGAHGLARQDGVELPSRGRYLVGIEDA